MEITIKINGQAVSVEISYEVYDYLEESKRKTENLFHQKRRHWDEREFDEYIVATECSYIYSPTPEEMILSISLYTFFSRMFDLCNIL